jgi:nucleoid DNA-binding protein
MLVSRFFFTYGICQADPGFSRTQYFSPTLKKGVFYGGKMKLTRKNKHPLSITRLGLFEFVFKKISDKVKNRFDVESVINILLDEMQKDLLAEKAIDITNFGVIQMKKMPSNRKHNAYTRTWYITPGYSILRIVMWKRIKKMLTSALDISKIGG